MSDGAARDATSLRATLLPVAAMLATVVLWASAFVTIRHVGEEVSAGGLALGRLLVASAVLGAVVLVRQGRQGGRGGQGGSPVVPVVWPRGTMWLRLALCGVVWFGLYNVALNAAERRVDAGTAAMLVNVGPILIAVLAGLVLREGFPRQLIVGCTVAFGGVAMIGMATSSGSRADSWGVLLCLVAAASYAVGMVVQKPLLRSVSALHVTWLAGLVGAAACLPFAPALIRDLGSARASTIWWVVYLGVLPSAVAFTTWAYALARTSAGRLGAATYLAPPIAILLGWALLDERPAVLALAGGIVCLVGVYLTRRRPGSRRSRTPSAEPHPVSQSAPPPGQ
ncbi:MAG: EamA family transporter [Micromonosporaceae bacterium]|nr:EamA family transporter [Micromonosporaceae bacterium]